MTSLKIETPAEVRLWERLQNILTATDHNKILVNRMLKDRKYVNAQFLQQLEDNANSVLVVVAEIRARAEWTKEINKGE